MQHIILLRGCSNFTSVYVKFYIYIYIYIFPHRVEQNYLLCLKLQARDSVTSWSSFNDEYKYNLIPCSFPNNALNSHENNGRHGVDIVSNCIMLNVKFV